MNIIIEFLVAALLIIGASFALVGSFGLIKLPDLMTRLHAPTKATTIGVGSALVASMLFFFFGHGSLSIHEILISIFLFLTAPITAHFVSKAWLHQHQPRDLPEPGKSHWSTFEAGEQEKR